MEKVAPADEAINNDNEEVVEVAPAVEAFIDEDNPLLDDSDINSMHKLFHQNKTVLNLRRMMTVGLQNILRGCKL